MSLTTPRTSRTGAYGFHLEGVPDAGPLLIDVPDTWPRLTLERGAVAERPAVEDVTAQHARLWLVDGAHAALDRATSHALLHIPPGVTDGALVHPYLAPVALIMSRWLGREGMHGGGIVVDGGVWAVLGHKTAGKSTTLAWMALSGLDVVSDDVMVVDDGVVLAGPRSIDLREEAATRLGVGEPLGRVGSRERWRLPLPPVAAELPLRGWITLEWGEEVAIERLSGAERLGALLPHRGVRLAPTTPQALLQLSALPHLRLVRPQKWNSLSDATSRLLDAIAT
jgi:hypothetical protein